jgi:PadR family transcriptional regulator, regulatory protein PadR
MTIMRSAKPEALGELEQLVLLAVLRLEEEAYGVMIVDELAKRTGRKISRPSVYLTLGRLEEKGLLRSRMGDPTPERGGRAKRYYIISAAAMALLRESRRAYLNLCSGLEPLLDRR